MTTATKELPIKQKFAATGEAESTENKHKIVRKWKVTHLTSANGAKIIQKSRTEPASITVCRRFPVHLPSALNFVTT